ncbi:hypothetical protein QSW07_004891, partial [Salmonella enterica]|nr:hypothetical protein [Salmonella enterica]
MPKQRRLDKVGATGHFPVDEVLTFRQRPFHERRERDARHCCKVSDEAAF